MPDPSALTYYLRRETVIPSDQTTGMARWRKALFAAMLLSANRSAAYYGLPLAQVVEIGLEGDLSRSIPVHRPTTPSWTGLT